MHLYGPPVVPRLLPTLLRDTRANHCVCVVMLPSPCPCIEMYIFWFDSFVLVLLPGRQLWLLECMFLETLDEGQWIYSQITPFISAAISLPQWRRLGIRLFMFVFMFGRSEDGPFINPPWRHSIDIVDAAVAVVVALCLKPRKFTKTPHTGSHYYARSSWFIETSQGKKPCRADRTFN